MALQDFLGRVCGLQIRRIGPPGAFLGIDEDPAGPTILLPRAEIPEGADVGTELDLFVYLDSEDRPIATSGRVPLELGEVTFLKAVDVTPIGAFFDWGLMKNLLVPFAEQTKPVLIGDIHAIGLYIDNSGRLAGTMRVREMLAARANDSRLDAKLDAELDEWVEGEVWRIEDTIGTFVIIERTHLGLVPRDEPHTLARGDRSRFRVTNILPDGKIELSLRGRAHEELESDAKKILATLEGANPPRASDRSTPDEIRVAFGLSKKAFKRAVGRLLKDRAVSIDGEGFLRPAKR